MTGVMLNQMSTMQNWRFAVKIMKRQLVEEEVDIDARLKSIHRLFGRGRKLAMCG